MGYICLTRERQMYMYNTGIILKSNEVTKNLSIRSCRSLNLINEIMVKFQARINDLEARNLIGCKSLRQIVDLCNAEKKHVIDVIVDADMMDAETKVYINPTGRFVIGGPQGDSGLTGRKIIVDTYGGYARHGGGAFSGKDPTKVDRSATYAARYVAKNIVAAGLADKCEIQLAYAIGVAKPVSINVNTFGTGAVADEQLEKAVEKVFDLRPTAIINSLGLRRPIYRQLAAYGHMGREDLGVSWEKTDKVDALLAAVK